MFDEQPDGDVHGECAAEIFNLKAVARYDAKQAEVFRKVVHSIRDAIPGGHEPDLEGLVIVIQQLVEKNVELKEQRDRWYGKAIERAGLTPNVKVTGPAAVSSPQGPSEP